jgi:hypothetical protein
MRPEASKKRRLNSAISSERKDLSADERTGLEGWKRFFEVNIIEKPEARALQNKIIGMEGELEKKRRAMPLGYDDPKSGKRMPSDSIGLGLLYGLRMTKRSDVPPMPE